MLWSMGRCFLLILTVQGLLLSAAWAEKLRRLPGIPSLPGSPIHYYAPNNKSVAWNGSKATIVVFNFGAVRQGEVWLSQEGVFGKSVLSCPHNGYIMAIHLHDAMVKAEKLAKNHAGEPPPPLLSAQTPMGEHVAKYYAELDGDTPVIRIDFGPQDGSETHTYRFNLQAGYRLIQLLGIMCGSLHGPQFKQHSASIRHLLKDFAQYNPDPKQPQHKKSKKKEKGPWLN